MFVITEALASLNVNQRRDVTRWSRGPPSRDCHVVVDPIKPMLLGDVINDRLRRVSRIRNLAKYSRSDNIADSALFREIYYIWSSGQLRLCGSSCRVDQNARPFSIAHASLKRNSTLSCLSITNIERKNTIKSKTFHCCVSKKNKRFSHLGCSVDQNGRLNVNVEWRNVSLVLPTVE